MSYNLKYKAFPVSFIERWHKFAKENFTKNKKLGPTKTHEEILKTAKEKGSLHKLPKNLKKTRDDSIKRYMEKYSKTHDIKVLMYMRYLGYEPPRLPCTITRRKTWRTGDKRKKTGGRKKKSN